MRWDGKDLVPLPKSARPERISENANVFDFHMADEDVALLETDEYSPCTWDPTKEPL
jgi:diketogulonate reductase-like aldo/keto reductase